MTCVATGQTSAQVVASSELPLGIFQVRHVELQFLWRRGRKRRERLASTCVLCSNDSQALASWKKLAVKFEQAQISRKPPQVIASWRSNEVQASKSKNLRWLAFSFDQGLIKRKQLMNMMICSCRGTFRLFVWIEGWIDGWMWSVLHSGTWSWHCVFYNTRKNPSSPS